MNYLYGMKRIQLFEFEDLHWVPNAIRTGATNLIVVFHKMLGTVDVLSHLIAEIKEKVSFNQIVDLGSGSGGPMIDLLQALKTNHPAQPLNLILSDLYPNPSIADKINKLNIEGLNYRLESTDAANIQSVPKGLKTMVGSFHHMNPGVARKILKSAETSKEPILIYELAKNNIPTLLWWILLPVSLLILFVMALIMTPFVKNLTWRQVLFTYLIPVIPIVYAWDGQASLVRTYTFDDVKSLIGDYNEEEYAWEIKDAHKPNGKKTGYYILGYPL